MLDAHYRKQVLVPLLLLSPSKLLFDQTRPFGLPLFNLFSLLRLPLCIRLHSHVPLFFFFASLFIPSPSVHPLFLALIPAFLRHRHRHRRQWVSNPKMDITLLFLSLPLAAFRFFDAVCVCLYEMQIHATIWTFFTARSTFPSFLDLVTRLKKAHISDRRSGTHTLVPQPHNCILYGTSVWVQHWAKRLWCFLSGVECFRARDIFMSVGTEW